MSRPRGQGVRYGATTRWAAIAAALVAASAPQVSGAQQPAAGSPTAESEAILLEADTLTQDDNAQTITAEGDVHVRHGGRTMRADRIVYDMQSNQITASGNVELVDGNGSVTYADEMQVDQAFDLAIATNLRSRLAEDSTLVARTAVRRGERSNELTRIIYTSCPVCTDGSRPPTWQLKARRAIQDREGRMISYRGMTLEALGVPVLWLPWFSHADPSSGPRSGFLTPDFGRDRRLGSYYEQPYYWRISDYQDVTVSARVHSHVRPLFGIDYRKRFWSGDLRFDTSFTDEQEFDNNGDTFGEQQFRGHIFGSGAFQINENWSWGFGVERVTDDLYLRRYGIAGAGERRGPYVGDSTNLVSQLYVNEQSAQSYGALQFISFQNLRENASSALSPLILPSLDYERVFDDMLGGQMRWRTNAVVLDRDAGADSTRVSSALTWRDDLVFGPGLVFSPFAEARADWFRINRPAVEDENFSRTGALAGAELSWPMLRAGENVDLIVEPIVMAAYGSEGGDDPRIINEDSASFELDDSNLFRPNAAPNFDLWEPGERGAAGIRATARGHNGTNASVLFGRRFRDEAPPGTILTEDGRPSFGPLSNLSEGDSDYVAAGQIDLGSRLGAVVRTRLDGETLDLRKLDAELRGTLGRFSAYARYYEADESLLLSPDDPSRELSTAIGVRLERGWRLQYAVRRDLDSDTNLNQNLRAIYEDDCTFLELSYNRDETSDRVLGPSEGFQIRIGLRTLGVLGGGG